MEASKDVSGEDWRRGKRKAVGRKSSKMEEEEEEEVDEKTWRGKAKRRIWEDGKRAMICNPW